VNILRIGCVKYLNARPLIRGWPGEVDFDASVAKDFKIHEALNFQFRVDAFNVINHTNFQAPSGALTVTANPNSTAATFASSSGFGKITGTQPNRQMQLSARFFF